MSKPPKPQLVIVHPGSMCGSGDYSAGGRAEDARLGLQGEIESGAYRNILVVDGELSDELGRDRYRDFGEAITRAATGRYLCDDGTGNFPRDAALWLSQCLDKTEPVRLAGAWYDTDGGCVRAIGEALRKAGFGVEYIPDSTLSSDGAPVPSEMLPPAAPLRPR